MSTLKCELKYCGQTRLQGYFQMMKTSKFDAVEEVPPLLGPKVKYTPQKAKKEEDKSFAEVS